MGLRQCGIQHTKQQVLQESVNFPDKIDNFFTSVLRKTDNCIDFLKLDNSALLREDLRFNRRPKLL